jgi:DNA processing protein
MLKSKVMDTNTDWLALNLIPGLGCRNILKLVDRFGSPDEIFRATVRDLQGVGRLRKDVAQRIRNKVFSIDPERELHNVEQLGARVISYRDSEYPRLLRRIPAPPMILYVKGRRLDENKNKIAMIGSRASTPYGIKTAERLSRGLVQNGMEVVSGMAQGIDSAAHWGALKSRGGTVAVLGTGIDRVYPRANRELSKRLAESGTLVSEFPLGTAPEAQNFPIRNRIISGLSLGVVVVEAAKKSGSLITASHALEQGREVFAVPGSVNSFKSKGCHFLLKQGAALAESVDDILEALGIDRSAHFMDAVKERQTPAIGSGQDETRILDLLGEEPVHIDHIVRASNLEPSRVLSLLTKMELTGIVEQLPGKLFIRT